MRQITLITLALILLTSITTLGIAVAQTSNNATSSAEPKIQEEKIQNLKDRLATKVAQLRENQKGAASGEIKEVTKTSFTLTTKKGSFKVNFNEDDTVIEELTNSKLIERKTADIKNGMHATVFGLVDKDKKIIDAKRILLKKFLATVNGIVTEKDSTNATLKVKTANGELYSIDVETTTTTLVWSGTAIVKSGFTKLSENDRVHIRGNLTQEEKKISAVRILVIPANTFKNEEASPSASASATPKATAKPASPSPTPEDTSGQ